MKAKAVKKLLMRGRHRSFWGRRAYITARLPIDKLGIPPVPPKPDFGKSNGWGGWTREEGGLTILTQVSKVSCGGPPDEKENVLTGGLQHDQWELREYDDNGNVIGTTTQHDYHWFELTVRVYRGETDPENLVETRAGDREQFEAYLKYREWMDKYGQGDSETESAILNNFLGTRRWAKTTYPAVDVRRNELHITYSVKWFNPNTKLRFCRDLAYSVREAKKAGADVRILKS